MKREGRCDNARRGARRTQSAVRRKARQGVMSMARRVQRGEERSAGRGGESAGRRGEHGKEGTVREEGRARRGWGGTARKIYTIFDIKLEHESHDTVEIYL